MEYKFTEEGVEEASWPFYEVEPGEEVSASVFAAYLNEVFDQDVRHQIKAIVDDHDVSMKMGGNIFIRERNNLKSGKRKQVGPLKAKNNRMSDCSTRNCDRKAKLHVPSGLGDNRIFCNPCYQAWKRGAGSIFTDGIPKPSKLEDKDDYE